MDIHNTEREPANPLADCYVDPNDCHRCEGTGCNVSWCGECGDGFTDPCEYHRAHGHASSPDPYDDGADCSTCCPACQPPRANGEVADTV